MGEQQKTQNGQSRVDLTEEQKACNKHTIPSGFQETFKLFDKNNDGFISLRELKICVEYFGLKYSKEELVAHLNKVDINGDGKIDFDEYLLLVSDDSRREEVPKEEIIASFQMFDKNKDGFVSAFELKKAMEHLKNPMTKDELEDMMRAADFNKDGRIDYREFTTMMYS